MITVPAGARIYLALGTTDMRKGFDGLAPLAQEVLRADPFSGHLLILRGKRASTVKIVSGRWRHLEGQPVRRVGRNPSNHILGPYN